MMRPRVFAALLAVPLGFAALPSYAQQDYDSPPAGLPPAGVADDGGYNAGAGAAQDAAGLGLRVNRLESRIREMTGQIEELQNDNRKLVEQLQKFQADVDSRVGTHGKRAEATPPVADAPAVAADAGSRRHKSGDDSFDPDVAPTAPGAPKPLGSVASAQPDDNGSAPMDLSGGKLRSDGAGETPAPTLRSPPGAARTPDTKTGANGTAMASIDPASPRAEYDAALGLYKDKQYDNAEKGFASFIEKNPKSRLAPDATYYLGATFAQRGRSREAAEQYLKISTEYANSPRAPEAMLHLGMSLKALGAKEQACATYSEVTRKYPNAPAYVKSGVERESKRAECS